MNLATPTTTPDAAPTRSVLRPAALTATAWPRFLLAAVLSLTLPTGLAAIGVLNDYRSLLLGTGLCFGLAALSLNVVLGYTGQLSLAHIALVGFGAFFGAQLTDPLEARLPFLPAVLIVGVLVALIGAVVGLPALRIRGLSLAIVTLSFEYAAWQGLFRTKLVSNGSAGVSFVRPWIGSWELASNATYVALAGVFAVALWLIDTNLTSSRLGRGFLALKEDEAMAASFGVPVAAYKLSAWALSGFYAGIAGALYGHLIRFANADAFRLDQSLLLVVIVVVGGAASRPGIAAAAGSLAVVPVAVEKAFGSSAEGYIVVIEAALLLVTVAFNPGGLAGAFRHAQERKAEQQAKAAAGTRGIDDSQTTKLPALPRPTGLPARAVASTSRDEVVLRADGVVVDFGGVRAVDNASVAVRRHRIVGLIGPNGAGKTTLFNAISGAVAPTSGRVELLGRDVSSLPAHRRAALGLGRTFQGVGLAKDRTVTENLLLAQHTVAGYHEALALTGLGPVVGGEKALRQRAAEAIEALGYERFTDTPIRLLSGGQQRIVELACALVTAPEVVLLDEPSAGMAPGAVENLASRLRDLRDDLGRTLVLVEHNIPLVTEVCDEVYVLAAGQVLAHGTPQEVVQDPRVVEAYLGGAL